MDFDSLSLVVSTLLKNRLKPGCLPQLPAKYRPTSLTEAYDLQEALNVAITKAGLVQVVGHKVGCTSKVMQQYMGISHPCSGSILLIDFANALPIRRRAMWTEIPSISESGLAK